MKNSLRNVLDDFSTVLVMLFLVLGSLFTLFVVSFQVHSEVVHLTRLGVNLLSQQPDWIKYARNYTEDQLEEADIDSYVEQGYLKGREWLATNVRSFVGAKDPAKAALLEKELTELVDKLYQMWEDRDKAGLSTSSVAGSVSEKDWMGHLKGLTSISTLKQEAVELVKANVDTIMSVAQSVWSVIAANISILSTILFAALTIVINFGLEIVNFFIEIIVFLTALYYLLASSHDVWLPIKWISDAVPRSFATTSVSGSSPEKPSKALDITTAIENAIRGVFVLSAKMSVFYGFYTYFIHALFDINVVFIPSMLAAIFAAIPIMAPHVVCIFGFLELYFAERETAAAILFVLASFAPK
ncbi:unnamed protein product, partial [Gongylonema pulchrum]|uniref:Transmembrane protein n=1 Tax=Gongylonema pulchrum TaxID=637853 RepID=A0A183EAK6_9BILA